MLVNLPFPTSLRSVQSCLGSLNYYIRYIEDFAIDALVLYKLRETEFFEISQVKAGDTTSTKYIKDNRDPTMDEGEDRDPNERTR